MPRFATVRFRGSWLAPMVGVLVLSFAGPAARAGARATHAHVAAATGASVGRARDIAATRAYIQANYQLTRVARVNLSASEGATHALARRIVGECPLGGEGSYTNNAASQFSEEVVGTIVTTTFRPDVRAIGAFTYAVEHLRWSDARLTHSVRRYVAKLQNLVALPPADICADVKAFAATSFRVAPEATISFDKRYLAADVEAEEVPLRLLAPYEGAQQAALLRRTKQLEAPIAQAEANAVSQYTAIMRGLALSQ
ncbi:MAG TPA: hypothetical protein VGL37_09840 [Solirubrobacteraceae bacterium]